MAKRQVVDKELEKYRSLLETPAEFKEGFGWSTILGIFFCGLIMMPGAIYLGLMTGGSMGAAATWVTAILFNEVARRALKPLNKQQLVVLLHAAGTVMASNVLFPGGPLGHIIYRAYLVTSDAVRDTGMRDAFPTWWVPSPDSAAILDRNLLHSDWIIPLALVFFTMIIGLVGRYTMGYFFFRLTSDIENLPFPLAPIQAEGAMALAEADQKDDADGEEDHKAALMTAGKGKKKTSLRWRLFTLGATMGIAFGMLQVGIPAITGIIFDKPVFIIPQPFVDTTTLTDGILPAAATGMVIDPGIIIIGFVLPFWVIMGGFIAIVLTLIANPIMHHAGILTHWQPGMDTVNTTMSNYMDFWMSFTIGTALGIALISIYNAIRDVRRKTMEIRERKKKLGDTTRESAWAVPQKGRGDYPLWLALVGYIVSTSMLVIVCYTLLKDTGISKIGLASFLVFFAFLYMPLVSYINARLLGIAGQNVDIPMVREMAFVLSGAQGVAIWVAPIPMANYGYQAQSFRVNELVGVKFTSLLKTDLVALPVLFLLSFMFWAFIWSADAVPSQAFPSAQINWELAAKQNTLLFTSTFVPEGGTKQDFWQTEYGKSIKPKVVGAGIGITLVTFTLLSAFGLPVMLIYGAIRGLGQMPHFFMLEVIGAFVGKFYFQKKFGPANFLKMGPPLLAGYYTGVGLIGMATIALKLISNAVSGAPF